MALKDKYFLCYVNSRDLFQWIKENGLRVNDFMVEKVKWEKEINREPNFFSDTELLLSGEDIILLKTVDNNHASFLAKTYKLEYQKICQKIFHDKKNVIIISDKQWKDQKDAEKLIVLFKDQENIKKNLSILF